MVSLKRSECMERGVSVFLEGRTSLVSLRSERVIGISRELDEIVAKITRAFFRGLVVAFDLSGKILYANDRVRFLTGIEEKSPVEQSFFEYIPEEERAVVVRMFREVHTGNRKVACLLPLIIGPHEVSHEQV